MIASLKRRLIGSLLISLLAVGTLLAEVRAESGEDAGGAPAPVPNRLELEEIVVTAARIEAPVRSVPKNVTVITREDIEQAPSNSIVDLLNREAGINLRSLFGNDKQAVIDVRGMGATAGSNVVVMVDGVRLNAADMSGTDFSTVLLEHVERIEIVRGAGSVIYGDGAVGGVINIVTKKGQPQNQGTVYASYGSFATADLRTSARGSARDLGYTLSAGYSDSDGYRENGDYDKKDIAGVADYYFNDVVTLNFSGAFHADRYGLPGPVSIDDADSRHDRVQSDYPDDHGETMDGRVSGGIEIDTVRMGSLKIVRGYRLRQNDFIVGTSPLLSQDEQTNEIEEFSKTLNVTYDLDVSLFGRDHKLQVGTDHYFSDYVREEAPGGPRLNSQLQRLGFYVHNQWSLAKPLMLQWGYRGNRSEGKFRTDRLAAIDGASRWVNGDTETSTWHNQAYDVGLTVFATDGISFFASYGTSFRTPNTDEFAEAEEGLKPQEGVEWNLGSRFRAADRLEVSVTFFHTTVADEIYYSEINRNYDHRTIRRGVETDLKFYWTEALFFWGNYAYTSAVFADTGNQIPLVPAHKGSAGMEWQVVKGLNLSLTGTLVGSRYDGNDLDNDRYEKLDAYGLVDGKVTYRHGRTKLFAGVNNLFDTLYATYAYSESTYTMPGRNAYAGLEWGF